MYYTNDWPPVGVPEVLPELVGLENLADDQRVEDDDGDVGKDLQDDQLHPHLQTDPVNLHRQLGFNTSHDSSSIGSLKPDKQ